MAQSPCARARAPTGWQRARPAPSSPFEDKEVEIEALKRNIATLEESLAAEKAKVAHFEAVVGQQGICAGAKGKASETQATDTSPQPERGLANTGAEPPMASQEAAEERQTLLSPDVKVQMERASSDPPRDAQVSTLKHRGTTTAFWFVPREVILELEPGKPLPVHQALKAQGKLMKVEICMEKVMDGSLAQEWAGVSHRWFLQSHPDQDGAKATKLKEEALSLPHIKGYWIDWCCIPQSYNDAGVDVGRTEEEQEEKNYALKNVLPFIYLGATVIILYEQQYAGRFWPNVELWTSMQTIGRKGLESASLDALRSRVAPIGVNEGKHDEVEKFVLQMWHGCPLAEVTVKLRKDDVLITNRKDINSCLQALQDVNATAQELVYESQTHRNAIEKRITEERKQRCRRRLPKLFLVAVIIAVLCLAAIFGQRWLHKLQMDDLVNKTNSPYACARVESCQQLANLAEVAPELVGTAIATLTRLSYDREPLVRQDARDTLASEALWREAPAGLNRTAIEQLTQKSEDIWSENKSTRQSAISALVAHRSTALAEQAMSTLEQLATDKDEDVRRSSCNALRELVQAAPELTSAVMATWEKLANDTEWKIRWTSCGELEFLGQVAPKLVGGRAMGALEQLANDTRWEIRLASCSFLASLGKVAPDLVGRAMDALERLMKDSRAVVRLRSSWNMKELVKAAPELAGRAKRALEKSTQDALACFACDCQDNIGGWGGAYSNCELGASCSRYCGSCDADGYWLGHDCTEIL